MAPLADGCLLDAGWFGLSALFTLGSLSLFAGLFISWRFGNTNPVRVKWFWRSLMAGALTGTVWLCLWRSTCPTENCFDIFLRRSGSISFTRTLALMWLAGMGLLLMADVARLIASVGRVRGICQPDSDWIAPVAARMGCRSRVRLVLSPALSSAFVYGLFRPVMVLPAALVSRLNRRELQAVIAHELAHVNERDVAWNAVELFFRRLLFFHPLAYIGAAVYRDVQEKAADQLALESLKMPGAEYARGFLTMVEWAWRRAPQANRTFAVSSYRKLSDRLSFIGAYEPGLRRRPVWPAWLIAFSLLLSGGWGFARSYHGEAGGVCVQVRHEKFLEMVLGLERETNKCEREK